MNKFQISTRLLVLLGLLIFMLLIGAAMGIGGLYLSNDGLRTVYEDRTVCAGQLDTVIRAVSRDQIVVSQFLLAPSTDKASEAVRHVEENIAITDKYWSEYSSTYLTPKEKSLADDFSASYRKYLDEGLKPAMESIRRGDLDAAQGLLMDKMNPSFASLRQSINDLIVLQLDEAKKEYDASTNRYVIIRNTAIAGIATGVLLALVFGLAMIRGIQRSLAYAQGVSRRIAEGDLTGTVQVEGRDEVARLLGTMNEMKSSLVRIVSEVRTSVDSVGTASAQIAAGNQDLSSRTEEQASSLEETAASMEQITSTVKQTADNSKQANQLANSASEAAANGGVVVSEVVATMESIAASSRKIAEIINVIDGIAFQTNILALNAAVEAARAGEQGRGFAVVAGEVRSLAQRSAQAAREIKLVIEESVANVEEGSRQANQAGTSMKDIVNQVKRVNDLIAEITSAALEQSSGINQVNEAVTQMDKVTQQNAALVEESAAAASSLQHQAQTLSTAVSVFKLGADSTRDAVAIA